MKKIILSVVQFSITVFSFGQTSFWNSRDAYLAQKPPGDEPVIFAPGKLADTGYWVGGRVAFSADGRQFFYGKNTSWFDNRNQQLMSFRFDGKSWKGPELVFRGYSQPTFAMDCKTLYLNGRDIYQTRHSDTGWQEPSLFLRRSYTLYNLMPTKSGRYYLGTNGNWGARSDYNSWKFAVLMATGTDTSVTSLGEPLNSPGFNGDLYIAPDESYMIVSAKESPTFESELYISFHKSDLKWTKPISLGPLINNGLAHRWGAYVSPDGKYLFYTKGTSEKDCTIYWVRFDRLLRKLKS